MFIAAPEKLPKFGAFSTLGTALVLNLGLVAPLVGPSRGLPLYALLVERPFPPEPGSGNPEPKFGETFGFALFRQGLVLFAHFLPVSLPDFARFFPHFVLFPPKKCRSPVSPSLPGLFGFAIIARICLFLFVVRMPSSLPPAQDLGVGRLHWKQG